MPSHKKNHRLFVYGTLRNDPKNEMFALWRNMPLAWEWRGCRGTCMISARIRA